jgi:hypothetical protein
MPQNVHHAFIACLMNGAVVNSEKLGRKRVWGPSSRQPNDFGQKPVAQCDRLISSKRHLRNLCYGTVSAHVGGAKSWP